MIRYISTRGGGAPQSFTEVLLAGLAPDGGLYVPAEWPRLDLAALRGKSYRDIAFAVIQPFVSGEIDDANLRVMIEDTYRDFKHPAVAPLVQSGANEWIMELFHGPTLAFKDYPLQLVGRLFDHVLGQRGRRVTIVGATSGDTGSAAIEACRGSKHIDIVILHPKGRTSEVQRRQMTTVSAPNVHNVALEGHFDDCQNAVKAMFADEVFREEMTLSAVNSINFARIMTQIVYYVAAAVALGVDKQRRISFAVPTGNFGNVYAAYCAKRMGLPIDRLVIGSNRNDILTRFFETGSMSAGEVEPSLSPSMDIQTSSNFERFLFELLDRDAEAVRAKMASYKQSGAYDVTDAQMARAREIFRAARCNDEQTAALIGTFYEESGYLIDPHTAVGLHAARAADGDPATPMVALACAHPAKFPDAVEKASGVRPPLPPHLQDLYERDEHFTVLPNEIAVLKNAIRLAVGS